MVKNPISILNDEILILTESFVSWLDLMGVVMYLNGKISSKVDNFFYLSFMLMLMANQRMKSKFMVSNNNHYTRTYLQ